MKLAQHIQRISQEDASKINVQIKDEAEVTSEAEKLPELAADDLIEAEPAADNVRAELEETMAIKESLEQFEVLLDQAVARGGMRSEEGVMFQTGLEHFQHRLGMVSEKLGLEDFGGNMSRLKATQISQEALSDVVQAATVRIKELIAKLTAFIKEAVSRLNQKGEKVKATVTQSQEIAKEVTKTNPTVKVELDLTKVTALTKSDLEGGFHVVITSAKDLSKALGLIRDDIKRYRISAKTLTDSDGNGDAIVNFNTDHMKYWEPCQPMVNFTGGEQGKIRNLSDAVTVTYVKDGALEVTTKEEARAGFKYEMTSGELIQLNGRTFQLNMAIEQLTKDYTETSKLLTEVLGGMKAMSDRSAASVLSQSQFDVVSIIKTDIYHVVSNLARARDQAGYIMGTAAKAIQLAV